MVAGGNDGAGLFFGSKSTSVNNTGYLFPDLSGSVGDHMIYCKKIT